MRASPVGEATIEDSVTNMLLARSSRCTLWFQQPHRVGNGASA
jgi:hypothetical protein